MASTSGLCFTGADVVPHRVAAERIRGAYTCFAVECSTPRGPICRTTIADTTPTEVRAVVFGTGYTRRIPSDTAAETIQGTHTPFTRVVFASRRIVVITTGLVTQTGSVDVHHTDLAAEFTVGIR